MKQSHGLLFVGGTAAAIGGCVIASLPIALIGFGVGSVAAALDISLRPKQNKIDFVLDRCKIELKGENDTIYKPQLLTADHTALGERYIYSIPVGMSIKDFEKKKEEIESGIGKKIKIESINHKAAIQVLENTLKKAYDFDIYNYIPQGLEFNLGQNIASEEVLLDLSGNDTHTLVVGGTGSGKSVCLDLLIVQFILSEIELSLVDMKAVTFASYMNYKHLKGFAIDEITAEKVLTETLKEMNGRYQLLLQHRCKNYQDFNERYPDQAIKTRILIIDEFQSLMDNKESKKMIFLLLSKARAANIVVILSCQSPRHDIVDGKLRDNIKNYIIFRCETEVGSEVATAEKGNDMATKLRGEGHGYLKNGGVYTEFQGYYLKDQVIEEMIKPFEKSIEEHLGEMMKEAEQKEEITKEDVKEEAKKTKRKSKKEVIKKADEL